MDVVILCGGKGTRSYPFTEHFPKVMMPIAGRPILVHLMHIYAAQGFTSFVLAAGHRKEILYDYFEGRFADWQVRIVDTGEDADTADRLRQCSRLATPTFFATYGDGLGNVDLHALLQFHQVKQASATVTAVPLRSQYGTILFDENQRVTRFIEKPVVANYWINAGFFVFERSIFEQFQGHNLESEVLPEIARAGLLYKYQHDQFWRSMDTSKDQQEVEQLYRAGPAPWMRLKAAAAGGSSR